MRRFATLFFVVLSCLSLSVAAGQNADKGDLRLFQGSWEPVFIRNTDGRLAGDDELKATRLVVKGNEFTFTNKDVSISGSFAIDPSKTPKTIDFALADAKQSDQKFLGVYEIRGERRLSCFALPGQARPRAVRPTEKGYLMLEWKPVVP